MNMVTTFARLSECENARHVLDSRGIAYEVIEAVPQYARVGTAALRTSAEGQAALAMDPGISDAGWVDFRAPTQPVPQGAPDEFEEDVFGNAAIMVLAPCVADLSRIRLIAHLSGNLAEALPYLNAEMPQGFFNANVPALTFMDGYRMVVLYSDRVTVAKADELVDAWRTLDSVRRLANSVWARRRCIEPSYVMRRKPPAIEIYKRLPGTNCQACGERTCLAFALRVWVAESKPSSCKPVFSGDYAHLKPALLEICAGLGVLPSEEPTVTVSDDVTV